MFEHFPPTVCYDERRINIAREMVLSSKYNFSLGFIPAIITLLAGTFLTPALAASLGAGIGLVFCLLSRKQLWPILLYGTTGMLLLLALLFFLLPHPLPDNQLPLLFEGLLLFPPTLLLLRGSKWTAKLASSNETRQHLLIQSTEAAIVSARILFILAILHAVSLLIAWLTGSPADSKAAFMLCEAAPPGIFIAAILLNQAGILYFNQRLKKIAFVPIVNTRGEIVGKKPLLATILRSDKEAVYPIVRIAVTTYRMLYLVPRPMNSLNEKGKTDLPLEGFLIYGESAEQAARRMTRGMFPQIPAHPLCFNFRYYYHDDNSNRLVYLFLLELKDDSALRALRQSNGKLWPLPQIEQDLGNGYFSKFLEQEFEPLKDIICTREKYKES